MRVLLHFDPTRRPWDELREVFRYTSYEANARARSGLRRLDGVSSIGHLGLDVVHDYGSAPRGDVARHPGWRFPGRPVGCPIGGSGRCPTAGGTVCKMLTLEQPFGWPADDFRDCPARSIGQQQLHVSRHLHFLLSSSMREDHVDSARRSTLSLIERLPESHHLILIVESASQHTDPFHMHIHNVNMICGSSEPQDGVIRVNDQLIHNPLTAARREVLEETGLDVAGCPAVLVPWSAVVTRDGRGPPVRSTPLHEFFLLVDVTDSRPPPAEQLARRTPDGYAARTVVDLCSCQAESVRRALFQAGAVVCSESSDDELELVIREHQGACQLGERTIERYCLVNQHARRVILGNLHVHPPG